ncbi:ankyrin repeat domain-containing protein [Pedobacter ginsengisoli]|uniref:ankyrin repeat domain-containing protein n=1 Tax=Pedobacter ginsengisoli TaxID=363852 RepID=UPI00254D73DF|nr:ankyrin repeat domain-containing protein [Pedobacter ginsengisoli]
MDYLKKIIDEIEVHSKEGIKVCFENGINPNDYFKGKPLIYELITEYSRGPKFKECFKVFVDYGLNFDDKILLSVFLDDAVSLDALLSNNKQALKNKYTFDCTFTPLYEVSLLHICAEYNHLACARILVKHGIDINIKAAIDENGFGGQTPIFHTVNQNSNKCIDVMNYLISESADLTLTVKGLVWGKGYEWETFVPSVNPLSYAMMGLLPQFQRTEKLIYEVVAVLLRAAYGIDYTPLNVPNKYLNS